jgi:AcrR family transcriptional regulator
VPRAAPSPPATPSSQKSPRSGLRADAERNRLTILAAATEALSEVGLDVSVEEIARRAGVGSATIYRRFATRADLLVAALQERVRSYADLIDDALNVADPWQAFSELLYALCERQSTDAGFRDLLAATNWPGATIGEHTQRAADGAAKLVKRAQRAGTLRKDFRHEDISMLMMANAGIARSSDNPTLWKRHINYVIDGLRART